MSGAFVKYVVKTETINEYCFQILADFTEPAGMFCRLQVAGCRLKFHYNWKTAETKNN